MTYQILFAGFGGQGILTMGKIAALAGLADGKEVPWLPSYGPEMRGGTANCSVIVSDEPICSPLITAPEILVAMNLPSVMKFENAIVPGGKLFYDSTLFTPELTRTDIEVYDIPASRIAEENGLRSSANIILLGHIYKHVPFVSEEGLKNAFVKMCSGKKERFLEPNLKAIEIGKNY